MPCLVLQGIVFLSPLKGTRINSIFSISQSNVSNDSIPFELKGVNCVSVMDVPNDTGESVLTDNNDKGEQRVAKLREYMRQKRLVEPGEYNNFRKIQRQNESLKDKSNASIVYLVLTANIKKFCMFVIPCSK